VEGAHGVGGALRGQIGRAGMGDAQEKEDDFIEKQREKNELKLKLQARTAPQTAPTR
jgi:hypothetical protein